MNLFRFVYIKNFQRRSGAVRHGAEHDRVRRHLTPIREASIILHNIKKEKQCEKYITISFLFIFLVHNYKSYVCPMDPND
jgi:hypothetical protein